jgi:hypothetical protein
MASQHANKKHWLRKGEGYQVGMSDYIHHAVWDEHVSENNVPIMNFFYYACADTRQSGSYLFRENCNQTRPHTIMCTCFTVVRPYF